jgi:hopanoid biosynthesis associated protein HpnK
MALVESAEEFTRETGALGTARLTLSRVIRRLIINADDFGLSHEVNMAVIRAHTEGVLTTASLMVNEGGFEEAVELARRHPRLGVGLHLSLVRGRSALPQTEIPNLVDAEERFPDCPVSAGIRFFFDPRCRKQLEREVATQFDKFHATRLPLDHVNGHLHFHLHPVVFGIVVKHARRWNVRHLRLTRDPFLFNAKLAGGRWGYRVSHGVIFALLSLRARSALTRAGIRHTHRVYGLLQHGLVEESFIARLLRNLPEGDSELYSHPSLSQFRHELDALLSPKAKEIIANRGIELIRYQDL